MSIRLRLLGVLDPAQIAFLYTDSVQNQLHRKGWTIERLSQHHSLSSVPPIDTITCQTVHKCEHMGYEIQDIAALRYLAFDASTSLESCHLYLQQSLLFCFQFAAILKIDDAQKAQPWHRIDCALRSLAELLASLSLTPHIALVYVPYGSDKCFATHAFTGESVIAGLGIDRSRLSAVSRVGSDCLLLHTQVDDLEVYSVITQLSSQPPINELIWYKYLIATNAARRAIQTLDGIANDLASLIETINNLDPLTAAGKEFLDRVNEIRTGYASTETSARNAQCQSEIINLFISRALPNRQKNIVESPEMQTLPMVLSADLSEFEKHFNSPITLIRSHIISLEQDVCRRLQTLTDIVSLNYNLRIQRDLRWLQIAGTCVAILALVIGLIGVLLQIKSSYVYHDSSHQQQEHLSNDDTHR